MSLPPATLLEFRAGSTAAFAEVVRAYQPMLRGLVRRYWKSPLEQEEAMQEVWLQAYRNREALDPDRLEAFPGWLGTLARRRCIDLLRAQGRGDAVEVLEAEEGHAIAEAPPTQEQDVARGELAAAVAAFEAKLGPEWQAFFRLHFVEGRSYPEVEAALGLSSIRCKYMKKVLVTRARRHRALLVALGRWRDAVQ